MKKQPKDYIESVDIDLCTEYQQWVKKTHKKALIEDMVLTAVVVSLLFLFIYIGCE